MKNYQRFTTVKFIVFTMAFCLSTLQVAAWSTAETISTGGNNNEINLAVDGSGNAVVVWTFGDYPYTSIQSATYDSGTATWTSLGDITGTGLYRNPKVAVDSLGNAVAVWEHYTSGYQNIESSQLPIGYSWTSPVTISSAGFNESPHIGFDGSDNAFAIWASRTYDKIVVTRTVSGSWITPVDLAVDGGNFFPLLATSNGSTVIALWYNQELASAFTSTFVSGTWGDPALINQSSSNLQDDAQIALNTAGTAFAVWNYLADGTILAASRPIDGDWSSTSDLISDDLPNSSPHVVVDNYGNAFAIWTDFNAIGIKVVRFDGAFWSDPVIISNTLGNEDAQIITNSVGTGTAIWASWDGGTIQTSDYNVDTGYWSYPPVEISSEDFYNLTPAIKCNSSGDTIAVWVASDGVYHSLQASVK